MIAVRGLHKEFAGGAKALKGINLEIKQGEFVVLLGPSGAGKSTLLRCLNGLIQPTSGAVLVNGVPIHQVKQLETIRRQVGMVFQQFNLVKRLTVLENVLCGRLGHSNVFTSCCRLFPAEDIKLANQCLQRVGLAEKALQRADTLSGGQQQRVGIARALAQCPIVILADEPVASLDPKSAERVMSILRDIHQADGITVLVSLHNVELAKRYGQRIIGVREGMLVLDKSAGELNNWDVEHIYGDCDCAEEFQDTLITQVKYAHA